MEPRYEVFSERGQKIAPKKVHQKMCEAYVMAFIKTNGRGIFAADHDLLNLRPRTLPGLILTKY